MSKRTYRIKTKGGSFIDDVRESPVDEYQLKVRRILLFLVAIISIPIVWYSIARS